MKIKEKYLIKICKKIRLNKNRECFLMEYKKNFSISENQIIQYKKHLQNEERAKATINKYIRDIRAFFQFSNQEVTKELAIAWKNKLTETYKASSVNSMIAAVNGFFEFLNLNIKIKPLKIQRKIFLAAGKELTRRDYEKLLNTAEMQNNERLLMIMQTLAATGIRINELKFITIDAVIQGQAEVKNKGKTRTIFISSDLKKALLKYIKSKNISEGAIFVTKSGKTMDRANVWAEMKKLCKIARVNPNKVYPHNFRHLFAVTFYKKNQDIIKLADILGHSDVNTTRIYVMQTDREYRRIIDKLELVKPIT